MKTARELCRESLQGLIRCNHSPKLRAGRTGPTAGIFIRITCTPPMNSRSSLLFCLYFRIRSLAPCHGSVFYHAAFCLLKHQWCPTFQMHNSCSSSCNITLMSKTKQNVVKLHCSWTSYSFHRFFCTLAQLCRAPKHLLVQTQSLLAPPLCSDE